MSILAKVFILFALLFGILIGHTAGRMEWDHERCYDTRDKYKGYEAWLSVRNGVYRCFWIENEYPNRVKMQGVIDVK